METEKKELASSDKRLKTTKTVHERVILNPNPIKEERKIALPIVMVEEMDKSAEESKHEESNGAETSRQLLTMGDVAPIDDEIEAGEHSLDLSAKL